MKTDKQIIEHLRDSAIGHANDGNIATCALMLDAALRIAQLAYIEPIIKDTRL